MGIQKAIDALKKGDMIIIVDDEHRENEGDLVIAAEHVTPEKMAFIIKHTGGVVCLALENAIADRLNLEHMVSNNTTQRGTAFTVSIDAVEGVTSGISASDRSKTVHVAVDSKSLPGDLSRPGHIFPLRAQRGGVLWRAGHTEASVDMCHIAGFKGAAVISELMHESGEMMRLSSVQQFSLKHGIPVISVADIIAYRKQHENFISKEATSVIETSTGQWQIHVYRDLLHDAEQVALVKGDISKDEPILVRVHSECLTGDVFESRHCDCGSQKQAAMKRIAHEGVGVLLYMKQEGRGIGLVNKIRAYELQRNEGLDTVEANDRLGFIEDLREYGVGAQILVDLGLSRIKLITNNPKKMAGIEGYGLHVVEQVPLEIAPNGVNDRYLKTKKDKMGHQLWQV